MPLAWGTLAALVWLGLRLLRRIPERPFFLFATWALALSGVKLLRDGVTG